MKEAEFVEKGRSNNSGISDCSSSWLSQCGLISIKVLLVIMPANGVIEPLNKGRSAWNVRSSEFADKTINLIRTIVEDVKLEPNPEKPMIPLSIGDPTTFGNLKPAKETIDAVRKTIDTRKYDGYGMAIGLEEARRAVAKYVAHQGLVTPNDIVLTSGCSTALDICIAAIAERGQNILVPCPGFSLYQTLSAGFGIEVRSYNLIPERKWEIDLDQLETLIDENTAALILNNPNNPCGSVFTRDHLLKVVQLAEKYFVPIIADEIYEHFTFPGARHIAVSTLSEVVPVLSCGGLTKRFLVPGWRLGWIVVHDRNNVFQDIRRGLAKLATRNLGPCTIIQGSLPAILENTPQSFFKGIVHFIYRNAMLAYELLKEVRGLKPVMPDGAMYMMIGIDTENFPEYPTEMLFVQDMVREQSVFCLPGRCFSFPNYFRIVLTLPEDLLREACLRIAEFCEKHYKRDTRTIENGVLQAVDLQ